MTNPKNSGYKLKPMYNGIRFGAFGSNKFANNENLTDEMAKKLIKDHPKGEGLFLTIPKEPKKEAPKKDIVKS